MKNYKVLPKSAENIEGNTSINSSVFIEQNNFPEQDSEYFQIKMLNKKV